MCRKNLQMINYIINFLYVHHGQKNNHNAKEWGEVLASKLPPMGVAWI